MKILSTNAYKYDGLWQWDNWRDTGLRAPLEFMEWSTRRRLKYLRNIGLLSDFSKGRAYLEDDQFNIVVVERSNHRPLYAVEYGPHFN